MEKYIFNKKKYLDLVSQNKVLSGWKLISTTFQLTGWQSENSLKDVKLLDLTKGIKLKKIGSFDAKSKIVVGDTDYSILNLRPGRYTAYTVADSLMIINDDLNIDVKKENIGEWLWKPSGEGVGVDSGMFGFFDLDTIHKIKNESDSDNNDLPFFDLPENFWKDNMSAIILDGSCIDSYIINHDPLLKDLKPFGVKADTIVGDGGFDCYVIGNDRAILIGGKTSDALYEYNNK